jgi:hypothetical protein
MSNFTKMYPEGKKIVVGGEEFVVKPFVLKNRTKVLRIVVEVLKEYLLASPGVTAETLKDVKVSSELMFKMVSLAGDRLIEVYEIVLGKDQEWLNDNVQLTDEFEILRAVSEVNDLPFLFQQAKSLMGTVQTQRKD